MEELFLLHLVKKKKKPYLPSAVFISASGAEQTTETNVSNWT